MEDVPIASHSFCVVEGCTSPATTSHRVTIWGEERQAEVCEKHEDTELTEDNVDRTKLEG